MVGACWDSQIVATPKVDTCSMLGKLDTIEEHDIHCEPKSYKFEFLEKLLFQHSIRALFGGGHVFESHHHKFISLIY